MTAHLLRVAGLTLACMAAAGFLFATAIRIAAADHPDPWSVVQIAVATALVEAAPIVAVFLAAWGALGALILLVLGLWTLGARAARWLRPKPERTTGGERS